MSCNEDMPFDETTYKEYSIITLVRTYNLLNKPTEASMVPTNVELIFILFRKGLCQQVL